MTTPTTSPRPPRGLSTGGRDLWRSVVEDHDLDATQLAQLHEACRAKDRCDRLDDLLRGDVETWARLSVTDGEVSVKIDQALGQANNTANLMKQLLAALRLPDEKTGRRPQRRNARGSYGTRPSTAVSSLDRARAAKSS